MSHFQDDILRVKREIYGMCSMVVTAIDRAMDAFLNSDAELAKDVIAEDKQIDVRENTIDAHVLRLLALHQPYADDFRFIITAIKVIHSLERIGDHAKALCRCVVALSDTGYPVPASVKHLANLVPDMVQDAVRALQNDDPELANEVRQRDPQVNAAYGETMATYGQHAEQKPEDVHKVLRLCEAMKHLERCGDVAKNICKDVLYNVEGVSVRHGGKTEDAPAS
ncbi:MAG: phosphate signaling complex protein PhoU [Planctomycetota bacterium]